MTRQKLLSEICPTDCIRDDICDIHDCSDCYSRLNKMLDEYDKQIRQNTIKEVISIADCSHTDCWDCAFADAELCKLQMLYKEYKEWNG